MQPDLGDAELLRIEEVFKSNWLGRGSVVTDFEAKFANNLNASQENFYAMSCCTEGLFLAAEIFGFSADDEIIVPTISFIAAGSAVVKSGASLVLCDVDPRTLNATAETIAAKYTSKTKAIILNHYGGYPCDLSPILEFAKAHDILVIEDSACAVQSFYKGQACGTFGDMGIWSFDAMKTLVTGDGGMIYLRSQEHLDHVKEECYLGLPSRGASGIDKVKEGADIWWEVQINRPGRRLIMNNISAAIGLSQLERLQGFIDRRKIITTMYNNAFRDLDWLQGPPEELEGTVSSHYFYWIQTAKRNKLAAYLKENGVYTSFRYWPLNWVNYFYPNKAIEFEHSDYAANHTLNLPLHHGLSDSDVLSVIDLILKFYKGKDL